MAKPFLFVDGTYDECMTLEPIVPGKFLICTDTQEMWYDTDNLERICLSGTKGSESAIISKFTATPALVKSGSGLTTITLDWELARNPSEQLINNQLIDSTSRTLTKVVSEDTLFGLVVRIGSQSASKQATVKFVDPFYWGTSSIAVVDASSISPLVGSLTESLHASLPSSFAVTANTDEYIYFMCPKSICSKGVTFSDGIFENGFEGLGIGHNSITYNGVDYWVYRSDHANLGSCLYSLKAEN